LIVGLFESNDEDEDEDRREWKRMMGGITSLSDKVE
jgi:hypothetical protein